MMRRGKYLAGALLALLLGACAAKDPQLGQLPPDQLYEMAAQSYEKGKWSDAIRELEQFTSRFPGDARVEDARYRLGLAYFENKEYITAAAELVRLASDYPNGRFAGDARLKTCESYNRLSPRPQLDQEYTQAAIQHCEALIASFPQSEQAAKAEEIIAELRDKLAEKAFLNGEYYFKRRAYDSAILYYESLLREYDRSPAAPRALLRLVQIYQRLRYADEMEAARGLLQANFPDSPQAREAMELKIPERG